MLPISRRHSLGCACACGAALLLISTGAAAQGTPPGAHAGLLQDTATAAATATGDTTASRRAQRVAGVIVRATARRQVGYAGVRSTTATRTDTPLRDTPQSVSVVTGQLIADQAMQGMADVVRYMPGITMGQGEGHRDAPTIRGTSSTADFFVDGVRDDAQYLRDVYNVERVEGLKGSNAMIFGRGGGGGVLNRVTKEAGWAPVRTIALSGSSHDQRRGTLDVGGVDGRSAFRVNGVLERSGSFREAATLDRVGINPTAAFAFGPSTVARVAYEYFRDDRTVDRGIPSFQGRPSAAPRSTFFGNPDVNLSDTRVHAAAATLEHGATGGINIRNRTRWTRYDKFYQNTFPGAVTADGREVAISAYNAGTDRTNLFNQTDVTLAASTGSVRHALLVGTELGRQVTSNARETGYFGTASQLRVPLAAPTISVAPEFRRSATDADNRVDATVAAAYVQDQIQLTRAAQLVAGLRVERFAVAFHNARTGEDLSRTDAMVSPRVGVVLKPAMPVSVYAGYSISHLPGSGDQFGSLTATTRTLRPERFTNHEVGVKWDVRSDLALTAATFRLDRTNTTARDPNDPAVTVQTGATRTTGWELGLTGRPTARWDVAAGAGVQDARIRSATTAAAAGATVPLVPHTTLSMWNKLRATERLSAALGVVHQGASYTAIDNTVQLPAFTRWDAALFATLTRELRAQVNVENLLDAAYFATSHGNNNIMPGAPRMVRVSMVAEW